MESAGDAGEAQLQLLMAKPVTSPDSARATEPLKPEAVLELRRGARLGSGAGERERERAQEEADVRAAVRSKAAAASWLGEGAAEGAAAAAEAVGEPPAVGAASSPSVDGMSPPTAKQKRRYFVFNSFLFNRLSQIVLALGLRFSELLLFCMHSLLL